MVDLEGIVLVVIVCFFVITSALGLCWALVPPLRRRSTRLWLVRRVGAVSPSDAGVVERVRFSRAVGAGLGGLIGVALGAVIAATAPLDVSFRAWPIVLGFAIGVLIGQSVAAFRQAFTPPAGAIRLARTRPARLGDHLPALMLWSTGLVLVLALVAGLTVLIALVAAGERGFRVIGLGIAVLLTVVISLAAISTARSLIRRPQPADTLTRMATLQALRAEQVHDLIGMLVTFAIATAALAASPLDAGPALPGMPAGAELVALALVGVVVVLAFVTLISSTVSRLTSAGPRGATVEA